MPVLSTIALAIVGIIIVYAFIFAYRKRDQLSSKKIMIMGVEITLLGGIVAVDPASDLGGIEYLVALIGFLIVFFGMFRSDKKS